jgi:hypothetical protein
LYELDWHSLSKNPNAIHLLEKNIDKIDWDYLCLNPNAVYILEQNLDKIHWEYLSYNSNSIYLFAPLNYEKMKKNIQEFKKELIEYIFNPKRLMRICRLYNLSFDHLNDIY